MKVQQMVSYTDTLGLLGSPGGKGFGLKYGTYGSLRAREVLESLKGRAGRKRQRKGSQLTPFKNHYRKMDG
jgi:hypothetical protein